MESYWLITWTCYGHWLPDDKRGFVGNVRDDAGAHVVHNIPETPYDADVPRLEGWVRLRMSGPCVKLALPDAEALILQFQETACIRNWVLEAASVMFDHTHLVVVVERDSDPQLILQTFKSWATRALNEIRPLPPNNSFWTAKGSKRILADDQAVHDGVIYVVKKQPNPLAIWFEPRWRIVLDEYDRRAESRERPGE